MTRASEAERVLGAAMRALEEHVLPHPPGRMFEIDSAEVELDGRLRFVARTREGELVGMRFDAQPPAVEPDLTLVTWGQRIAVLVCERCEAVLIRPDPPPDPDGIIWRT